MSDDRIVIIDLQLTEHIESMFKEYINRKPKMILDEETVIFGSAKKPNITMNRKMILDEICKKVIESGADGVSIESIVPDLEACKFASQGSALGRVTRHFKVTYPEWKFKKNKSKLWAIRII